MIAVVEVRQDGTSDLYTVPLAFVTGAAGEDLTRQHPGSALAGLEMETREGVERGWLVDALEIPAFCAQLLEAIGRRRRLRGQAGEVVATATRAYRQLRGPDDDDLSPALIQAEQSNTSVVYGERLVLKLFRRLSEGTNPDLELGRFLTEGDRYPHTPLVAGAFEYQVPRREPMTLGILHGYIENEGNAWEFTLDQLARYFEDVDARPLESDTVQVAPGTPLDLVELELPPLVSELVGPYLEIARLLGQRTAELHLALASDPEDPAFAAEPFTSLYQRSLYQSMRNSTQRNLPLLREKLGELSGPTAAEAAALLAREEEILEALQAIVGERLEGSRIRVHGDYHLGQVLYTGSDFVIIDFEGEPARSLSERKIKRSPLLDVAGMLRSFEYAAHTELFGRVERGVLVDEEASLLRPWARFWSQWVRSGFLLAYLPPVSAAGLIPRERDAVRRVLRVLLLDKALYELGYELNNRPSWARVPIRGILDLLDAPAASSPPGDPE
jgi:maltose alpha-D-glucosyltransferase/alpha-amylase